MKKTVLQTTLVTIASLLTLSSLAAAAYGFNSDWHITVGGAVQNPLNLTINDLAEMPQTTVQATIVCYGDPVTGGNWTGVQLGYLLQQAGVGTSGDISIDFKASDGYQINDFPVAAAQRSDIIIAVEKDGAPLTEQLRLVVPGANGNVWISMITEITIKDSPGFSVDELSLPKIPNAIPDGTQDSSTSETVQSTVQPSQNTTSLMPWKPEQPLNQSTPVLTGTQATDVSGKTEPAGSSNMLELGFSFGSVILFVGVAAAAIVKRRNKQF